MAFSPSETPADPGDAAPVIEAQNDFGAHAHAPGIAANEADHIDLPVHLGRRHEIEDGNATAVGLEPGFENAGFTAITTRAFVRRLDRRDQPTAVLRAAEQGGKHRRAIEARKTKPIDRPVAPHEGCRVAVTDDPVIFDRSVHRVHSPSPTKHLHALGTSTISIPAQSDQLITDKGRENRRRPLLSRQKIVPST